MSSPDLFRPHPIPIILFQIILPSLEENKESIHEVASNESSWLRSSGWKLQLFKKHLNEMVKAFLPLYLTVLMFVCSQKTFVEDDMLKALQRLQNSFKNVSDSSSSTPSSSSLSPSPSISDNHFHVMKELIQVL